MERVIKVVTPIGDIRIINKLNMPYFCMKDVCVGLGFLGHSPWSWHIARSNNREKYYNRFDLNTACLVDTNIKHNVATFISLDGLVDFMDSPLNYKGSAMSKLKDWVREVYKVDLPDKRGSTMDNVEELPDVASESISINIELITPEIAQKYLAKNIKNNRSLRSGTVRKYGMRMLSGEWQFNHEGIAFNDKGELVDGQHRLHAIIFANTPVRMVVTRGVKHREDGMYIMDSGLARTANQIIDMSDVEDKQLCKFATPIMRYTVRAFGKSASQYSTPEEIVSFVNDNKTNLNKLYEMDKGTEGRNNIQKFVLAVLFFALLNGENEEKIDAFIKCYKSDNVEKAILLGCSYQFAMSLRDDIKSIGGAAGSSGNFNRYLDICKNKVYSFCNGYKRTTKMTGLYPLTTDMVFKIEDY